MSTFIIAGIVFFILFFALLSGWLAKRIGKDYRLWFWMSLLLPVVALCILLCLPEEKGQKIVIVNADEYCHWFREENSTTILN